MSVWLYLLELPEQEKWRWKSRSCTFDIKARSLFNNFLILPSASWSFLKQETCGEKIESLVIAIFLKLSSRALHIFVETRESKTLMTNRQFALISYQTKIHSYILSSFFIFRSTVRPFNDRMKSNKSFPWKL